MNMKTLLAYLGLVSFTLFIGCTKEAPSPEVNNHAAPAAGAVNPTTPEGSHPAPSAPVAGAPGAPAVPVPAAPTSGAPAAKPAAPPIVVRLPYNITPTEKQKGELEKIQKKYGEQLETARVAVANALTEEQKKARIEAGAKARVAGKTGKDLVDAINNAAKITPDQQKKLMAAQQDLAKVSQEMNKEMMALLTPEQREELKKKAEELRKNNPSPGKPVNAGKPGAKPPTKKAATGKPGVKPKF